jgi:hypothetical protein
MNEAMYNTYQDQAIIGTIPDELNPVFIFDGVPNSILQQIVDGKIDANTIAKHVLNGRF